MKSAVFEYIEIDYNRHRRHSANGGLSPVQFEEKTSLKAVSTVAGQDQYVSADSNIQRETVSGAELSIG
ncbi:hypothetical protein GCM10023078_24790 [Gibbsiella greigii]